MSRKLASIRIVDDVLTHPNADALDIIQIDGWQCVAAKGDFSPGDLCCYFEIGSFLPVIPVFEFLRKGCFRDHPELGPGFRIKTCKLRSELSQGLAMPINKLPELGDFIRANTELTVTRGNDSEPMTALESLIHREPIDVTGILGVKKYETPIRNSGGVNCGRPKSTFPDFIPKTDQERIQNCWKSYSNLYKHDDWEVTLKLDGSSMTVFCNLREGYVVGDEEDEVVKGLEVNAGVCSRNLNLKMASVGEPAGDFVNFVNETGLLKALVDFCKSSGRSLALQGELMGPRIQKNREGFDQHFFYLFDVFDIDQQKYLNAYEREDIFFNMHYMSEALPRFRHVPGIAEEFRVFEEFGNLQDLLDWVNDARSIGHEVAEGYVFKNIDKPHLSFKVISNRFLTECDTED